MSSTAHTGAEDAGAHGRPAVPVGGVSDQGAAQTPPRSPTARQAAASQRRGAERRRAGRRRLLAVGVAIAVVLLVAAVVLVVVLRSGGGAPAASPQVLPAPVTGAPTTQPAPEPVADTSGIPGALAWNTGQYPGNGSDVPGAIGHDHVPGPVRYAVTPPVGGPHHAVWMNAGVYTAPVPVERAVHDLEHGAVWITYAPGLPAAQVRALTAFVHRQSLVPEAVQGTPGQANRYVVLSPWGGADLPSPVVISAWGHQLRVGSAGDPRLQQFVDTFRNSSRYTPEHGSVVDSVPVRTGGRPADDGGSRPNPAGRVPSS